MRQAMTAQAVMTATAGVLAAVAVLVFAGACKTLRPESDESGGVGASGFEATHEVAKPRTVLAAGGDGWTAGRESILAEGTGVRVLETEGLRARVLLSSGRSGLVYAEDLREIEPPSVPVLSDETARPAFPVSEPVREDPPVDMELMEQANEVDMPAL